MEMKFCLWHENKNKNNPCFFLSITWFHNDIWKVYCWYLFSELNATSSPLEKMESPKIVKSY